MKGYRIKQQDKTFYFELIPSNNNNQPIGYSKSYPSYEDCVSAIKQFRNFIKVNNICSKNSPYVELIPTEHGVSYHIIHNNTILFYGNPSYQGIKSVNQGLTSLYQYIEDYTFNEIK